MSPDWAVAGLGLDSIQQNRLRAINALYTPKLNAPVAALKAAKRSPTSAELSAMKALLDEYMAAMRAVLTPAQQKLLDQNQANMATNVATTKVQLNTWKNAQ